jgi:1-aminocyclopropane-1-carboxylate deaminase/D-cysteine desulfhydrase-like pyridoxal-dependent ACC family enzyme
VTPVDQVEAGLYVKRDDLYDPVVYNGKMRGVTPYFEELKRQGHEGVVNAAATFSNAHAIAARAGELAGLKVVTMTNAESVRGRENLLAAERLGARLVCAGPGHLGPLKARAKTLSKVTGYPLVPWGFADPLIVARIGQAVVELRSIYDIHVVPVGSGVYAAAITGGLHEYDIPGLVVGVTTYRPTEVLDARLRDLIGEDARGRFELHHSFDKTETPWESDEHYEYGAWTSAIGLARQGQRVLFWSVGRAAR